MSTASPTRSTSREGRKPTQPIAVNQNRNPTLQLFQVGARETVPYGFAKKTLQTLQVEPLLKAF